MNDHLYLQSVGKSALENATLHELEGILSSYESFISEQQALFGESESLLK